MARQLGGAGDKFQEDFPRDIKRELRSLLKPRARILTLAEGIDLT